MHGHKFWALSLYFGLCRCDRLRNGLHGSAVSLTWLEACKQRRPLGFQGTAAHKRDVKLGMSQPAIPWGIYVTWWEGWRGANMWPVCIVNIKNHQSGCISSCYRPTYLESNMFKGMKNVAACKSSHCCPRAVWLPNNNWCPCPYITFLIPAQLFSFTLCPVTFFRLVPLMSQKNHTLTSTRLSKIMSPLICRLFLGQWFITGDICNKTLPSRLHQTVRFLYKWNLLPLMQIMLSGMSAQLKRSIKKDWSLWMGKETMIHCRFLSLSP